jgi:hypothetical protein
MSIGGGDRFYGTPKLGTTGMPLFENTFCMSEATALLSSKISEGVRGSFRSLSCLNAMLELQGVLILSVHLALSPVPAR